MTEQTPPVQRLATQIAASRDAGARAPQEICGDFDMRIARDGTWYYQGTPIGRHALVKLFSTVLRRDEEGVYWLQTPVEKGRIEVEDAPFVAVEMMVSGAGHAQVLSFRTNVDDIVVAGPANPLRVEHDPRTGEPSPYVRVRDGLDALIARAVYYDLVNLAEAREVGDRMVLGVWSGGDFFELGAAETA